MRYVRYVAIAAVIYAVLCAAYVARKHPLFVETDCNIPQRSSSEALDTILKETTCERRQLEPLSDQFRNYAHATFTQIIHPQFDLMSIIPPAGSLSEKVFAIGVQIVLASVAKKVLFTAARFGSTKLADNLDSIMMTIGCALVVAAIVVPLSRYP